jgi:hypothetical protein
MDIKVGNAKYYHGIFLEGLRRTAKNSVRLVVSVEVRTP